MDELLARRKRNALEFYALIFNEHFERMRAVAEVDLAILRHWPAWPPQIVPGSSPDTDPNENGGST